MAGRRTWPRNLPWVYADDHFREVAGWANGELGALMRAWWPEAFPGTPWESVIGFASNGSPDEVVQVARMSELGWAGITGGPRGEEPPTRSTAVENQWLDEHDSPFVYFCLNHAACMTPGCWRPSNGGLDDQTAVGIATLIAHGDKTRSMMPTAMAPRVRSPWAQGAPPAGVVATPMSLWGVVAAFWGWSSGDRRAATMMSSVPVVASFPEGERFWRLGSELADAAYLAPLGGSADDHSNPAYAWIRCAQKLWMASVIAEWSKAAAWNVVRAPNGAEVRIGGEPAWFFQGAPDDPAERAWIVSTLAARASGHDPAAVGIGPRPAGGGWSVVKGIAAAFGVAAVVVVAAVAVDSRNRR